MKVHSDFNGSSYENVQTYLIDVPRFQRDLSEKWVAGMTEDWNSRLFRPITLSKQPDGRYHCLDGQHSLSSAIRRGHTTIPAIVYENLSESEEAAVFSDLNSQRRKPESYDLWVADLVAGRDWAVALQRLAAKYGLVVAKGGNSPTYLRAVGALRGLLSEGEVDAVDDALDILTTVYDGSQPTHTARVERALILGMVDLIKRASMFGVYDKAAFKKRLARGSYRLMGQSQPVTPDGFQSYINSLVASGSIVVPALNSGSGQSRIYGKAFAFLALGREQAATVYP